MGEGKCTSAGLDGGGQAQAATGAKGINCRSAEKVEKRMYGHAADFGLPIEGECRVMCSLLNHQRCGRRSELGEEVIDVVRWTGLGRKDGEPIGVKAHVVNDVAAARPQQDSKL